MSTVLSSDCGISFFLILLRNKKGGGSKMILGLPSHELDWKDTYFFASPATILGKDKDLPLTFHKPGRNFGIISCADLKVRN